MPVESKPTPIVKWVGGKRQLQDELLGVFKQSGWDEDKSTYFEPFFGGGSMFFALQPKQAQFSDLNPALIALYKMAKGPYKKFAGVALELQDKYNSLSLQMQKNLFEDIKAEFNSNKQRKASELKTVSFDFALQFLFLNKTGFNGMYRENSSGLYNIPFGQRSRIRILDLDNLKLVHDALKNVEPVCGDYREILFNGDLSKGDLVYLDPPYAPANQSGTFSSYHRSGFGNSDQVQVAEVAGSLAAKGAHVVISNSDNADVFKLYRDHGLYVYQVDVQRFISGKLYGRGLVREMIATSYEVSGLSKFRLN
ncbi:MAG: hypothetical protein RLZ06_178 [Actinomycetota bacterium]|jgi:DNA adenine methylase